MVIIWTHADEVKEVKEETPTSKENSENDISKSPAEVKVNPVIDSTSDSEINNPVSQSSVENSDCEIGNGACNNSGNICVVNADVHKENDVTLNGEVSDSSNSCDTSSGSTKIVYNVHIDERVDDVCINCRHRIVSNKSSCRKYRKCSRNMLKYRHTL